jgi:hypothetical protein
VRNKLHKLKRKTDGFDAVLFTAYASRSDYTALKGGITPRRLNMWYYAGICLKGLNKPHLENSIYPIENVYLPNRNKNDFRQLATFFLILKRLVPTVTIVL